MKKLRILTLALLAAAGCTVEGGGSVDVDVFDPIGGDVSVDALWTINGQPASAATCAEIGASTVVLEVWDSSRGNFYTEAAWEVACASGGFVTGPVLFPDTYDLRFVAYDAAGVEVLATDYARVTALAGDIIEVTGNFVGTVAPTEATLSGSWEIDGVTADAASCAAAGIDEASEGAVRVAHALATSMTRKTPDSVGRCLFIAHLAGRRLRETRRGGRSRP